MLATFFLYSSSAIFAVSGILIFLFLIFADCMSDKVIFIYTKTLYVLLMLFVIALVSYISLKY